MIAIVDYGMGNLKSVKKAFSICGSFDIRVTSSASLIDKADKIVMPGVGALGEAMKELSKLGIIKAIKRNIVKKPYLGICLGLQLLFEESQEGKCTHGLGVLKGKVLRFSGKQKIPHMGWNNLEILNSKNPLFRNIPYNSYFYFCHSYYVAPSDIKIIAATTDYGVKFASSIAKDNIFAVQFHPEKSQELGLRIIKNFIDFKN